ncbi:MAG TPA: Fic family protein [Gammaproteobacteria bacterium]|nr:Fic family protein [Gammaproteobacteria bacterium]
MKTYDLRVSLPEILSAISHKFTRYQEEGWIMLTPRHTPNDTLIGHLTYALKYEGINLSILKALFDVIKPEEMLALITLHPTGSYTRKLWFLYEWLQNTKLALPDAKAISLVDVVDTTLQYAGLSSISKRHRVRNNLPGTPDFCPMIRKTQKLEAFISMNLSQQAQNVIDTVHPDILTRAAAFLLLKDSKASFAIERETPPQKRAERWGQTIGQAGSQALSDDEFLRLQEIIISDFRFTHYGYRNEGGFIGEHERSTGMPIPAHISARPQDLYSLMNGLIATNQLLQKSDIDAVLAAASIAFGFVFIHPFEDGNGRIHRYLIHHVLAEKKFTPMNIIFPVSSVILEHIKEYREILESYSKPLLRFIQWRPTERGNIEVLNNTINFYRYFDATRQAEFLYECIKVTIEKTLPEEVDYLKKYDEMKTFIRNYIDMPDRTVDLLFRFMHQEKGILSKRARKNEFSSLTEEEVKTLEKKYAEIFS